MAKRANGEGTISKRVRNGKVIGWRTAITVGYDEDGRQIRRWISGKTQAEVKAALQQLQADLQTGNMAGRTDLTVEAFYQEWLRTKESKGVKPNTLRSYSDTGRLYILPYLGAKKLSRLEPLDVERLLIELRKAGKSPAILRYTLRILKSILNDAVAWNKVPRNVAARIRPPQSETPEMQVWTAEEVATFLRHARSHRLYAAFYLAVFTGMRRGEILGLQWEDIDWERSCLRVRWNLTEVRKPGIVGKHHAGKATVASVESVLQTPKTKKSCREIFLSPGTLDLLRRHQQQQQDERTRTGQIWQDSGYVFASETGGKTEPRTLYGWYRQIEQEAGLPHIRFHDLRHTSASLMAQQGISPKVVSDRLGHSNVAFTQHVYTHLYADQRQEAAFDLEDLRR